MISLVFSSISFIIGLGICLFFLFSNKKKDYSIFNCFPFEMSETFKSYLVLLVLVFLFVLSSSISYVTNLGLDSYILSISSIILEIIGLIGILIIFMFKLDYYKFHLIGAILLFIGTIGGNLSIGINYFINLSLSNPFNFNSVIAIVLFIIGILQLGLVFIPQLKTWSSLQKTEENGKTIYIRPKFNGLTFLEWVFIYSQVLSLGLLIINSILMNFFY